MNFEMISAWAEVIMAGAAIWAIIYGIWWVWPNFRKQKRIENLTKNAEVGVKIVGEIEEEIKRLRWCTEQTSKQVYIEHIARELNSEHLRIQRELSYKLNELRTILSLLRKNENLIENRRVAELKEWSSCLDRILNRKLQQVDLTCYISIDVLSACGISSFDKDFCSIDQLEELRDLLLSIYEMNINIELSWEHVFGIIIRFSLLTIFVLRLFFWLAFRF